MSDSESGSVGPFVAAASIFAFVVIGIGALVWFRSGDGLTDQGRVGRAVNAQNDALQRKNYRDYSAYTCTAVRLPEDKFVAEQTDSERSHGNRFIDDVKDIAITGETASAKVTAHYANTPDNKQTTPVSFAREDGSWKVCTANQ